MNLTDILVKNGLIVTMDEDRRIIEKGSIEIEDKRIKRVGKSSGREEAEEVIDAGGKIVMPGLICSHTHTYGLLLRAAPLDINPPSDLVQILQRVWWPVDEAMTQSDARASAMAACLEFMKAGTTLFVDTYSGPNSIGRSLDMISSAIGKSGLRAFIGFEATERHTRAEGARGMQENIRFLKKIRKKNKSRVQGLVSLHASFTISNELLRHARRVSRRFDAPITIHASEGQVDLQHNLQMYGKRTVERLYDVGVLSPNTVLTHCVHVNDDEISLIERTGARVAHNPMSNMLNGVGVAPVPKMLESGTPVGLGNDGYIFDGFENLRSAYLIHKANAQDPRVITPTQALEMATINGAKLYGLEKQLGSIEVGKLGDIIIINPDSLPTPLRRENVIEHLINSIQGRDVETVIVDGRLLMREERVITLDEEEVVEMSRKSAEKIWRKLGAIKR